MPDVHYGIIKNTFDGYFGAIIKVEISSAVLL